MTTFHQVKIGVLSETQQGERRVALVPDVAVKLVKIGFQVILVTGAGVGAEVTDDAHRPACWCWEPVWLACKPSPLPAALAPSSRHTTCDPPSRRKSRAWGPGSWS